ncbi:hypothetical protein RFN25_18110 [Mesorhizobium abyssinicae]|uniref:hypothetical protein n=1 Tax=Mesorhizobium abyssinicae TaxID=1209958 RepID=UPI002A249ECC|nr:hypothetical protein [Mesorhizobium abyssinicae]MDX8435340.1 hypothetical protein [Mesorhizobium abyssinicae]
MGMLILQQAVNWFLGAVIGGAIAFAWQRRGWVFQQNLKRGTDKYEAQVALTREAFSLVDKRIFASRLYLDALIGNDQKNIATEREKYRKVVEEWNEKISGLVLLIRVRFDFRIAVDFDRYFLAAFTEIDRKLREKRIGADKEGVSQTSLTKGVKNDLASVNRQARASMLEMLRHTSETLKLIEDNPKIEVKNKSQLTYYYLIKHLFKSRQQT